MRMRRGRGLEAGYVKMGKLRWRGRDLDKLPQEGVADGEVPNTAVSYTAFAVRSLRSSRPSFGRWVMRPVFRACFY
jgi:hypothetical protein